MLVSSPFRIDRSYHFLRIGVYKKTRIIFFRTDSAQFAFSPLLWREGGKRLVEEKEEEEEILRRIRSRDRPIEVGQCQSFGICRN